MEKKQFLLSIITFIILTSLIPPLPAQAIPQTQTGPTLAVGISVPSSDDVQFTVLDGTVITPKNWTTC